MLKMRSLFTALALVIAPMTAFAASPNEAAPAHLTEIGDTLSLGFGVTPLRPQLEPPRPSAPADLGLLESTTLSFDLKLKWPGTDVMKSVQPYLVVGPALFVVEPDYLSRLLGTRVDPDLRVGARAGAGLDWHVGKDLTLFGAWETTGVAASPRSRTPADSA